MLRFEEILRGICKDSDFFFQTSKISKKWGLIGKIGVRFENDLNFF